MDATLPVIMVEPSLIIQERSRILDRMHAYFVQEPGTVALFLRGSMAEGTTDAWSDIDLAVVVEDASFERFCEQQAIDNVWTPRGLEMLLARLGDKAGIRVFWLQCRPEDNRRRDHLRPPYDVMGNRVDQLRQELETMVWPSHVRVLDTTNHTIEQTIQTIDDSFQ